MTSAKKTPPKFHNSMSHSMRRNKIKLWEIVTTVDKNERAIIVLLDALERKLIGEKTVHDMRMKELNTDNGMAVLFRKFDVAFKNETVDGAYSANSKFITFEKQTEMSVKDYIVEYKHLHRAMREHNMPLPDNAPAFKLLDGANLSQDERKLTLILPNEKKFKTIKSALKRLFTVQHNNDENDTLKSASVKQEKAYYSKKGYVKTKNKKDIYTHNLF